MRLIVIFYYFSLIIISPHDEYRFRHLFYYCRQLKNTFCSLITWHAARWCWRIYVAQFDYRSPLLYLSPQLWTNGSADWALLQISRSLDDSRIILMLHSSICVPYRKPKIVAISSGGLLVFRFVSVSLISRWHTYIVTNEIYVLKCFYKII